MENQRPNNSPSPSPSEEFRTVRNASEPFGKVPHDAEEFGTVRQPSEPFGTVRNVTERKESHTLTVREAARMFESAGVARTERSIVNWCQPNPQGLARLDAYYDMNERKWFITPQSVERAIAEEKAKAANPSEALPNPSEAIPEGEGTSEPPGRPEPTDREPDSARAEQLEKEVLDLKILNGGKDFVIKQLREERDGFIQQLVEGSRRIGQLEAEVRQLSAPQKNSEIPPPLN